MRAFYSEERADSLRNCRVTWNWENAPVIFAASETRNNENEAAGKIGQFTRTGENWGATPRMRFRQDSARLCLKRLNGSQCERDLRGEPAVYNVASEL